MPHPQQHTNACGCEEPSRGAICIKRRPPAHQARHHSSYHRTDAQPKRRPWHNRDTTKVTFSLVVGVACAHAKKTRDPIAKSYFVSAASS